MLGQLILAAHLTVVCHPTDSLRPLADEIAREEATTVVGSWSDVRTEYLIWVVEPGRLSDQVLASFARDWRDRFPETAVGLIIGRTPDQAKALWCRARQVRPKSSFAFDATASFSKQQFVEAIKTAGYVTFAGHGGQTYLELGANTVLRSTELPPVPNLVFGTASCNVFRPWVSDSIALAFVENGAAAFAGFAYSPEAGFLIGGSEGLPFRYTYPEFPIGRVVQLQNHGAMQAFAALPIYFLLGDPRISFAAETPYRIVADETRGDSRQITLTHAPRGFLPVCIRGGAAYRLIEGSGTAAARDHGFYNSRLQAVDSGSDKFVLVDHTEGPLTFELQRVVPWWWPVKTRFVEALDNALVFFGSSSETCAVVLVVGLITAIAAFCRRVTKRVTVQAAAAGALLALLHLGWVLTRLDHTTVISKSVSFNPLAIICTLVLTSGAAALYLLAAGRTGQIIALLLATFPAWFPAVLHFGFTLGTNVTVFRPHVGASVYSHRMALLAASSFAIILPAVSGVFASLRRRVDL